MQEEMIREIEASRPAYMVLAAFQTSWIIRPGSPRLIFDWFRRYSSEFYDCVEVFDVKFWDLTEYHGDKDAEGCQPSLSCFYVFKRKPDGGVGTEGFNADRKFGADKPDQQD